MWKKTFLVALLLGTAITVTAGELSAPVSYNLIVEGNLPEATLLRINDLDAKDAVPIELTLAGARVHGAFAVEPGKARRLALRAESPEGKTLYEGQLEVDVGAEFVAQATIELKSALDGAPAEVTIASHRIAVEFGAVDRDGVPYTRLTTDVFDADGLRLVSEKGELDWDIADPWIRERLLPCRESYGHSLCAEFPTRKPDGFDVIVNACYRGGICQIAFVPPAPRVWQQIALGLRGHACALKVDGTAYCWGQGELGQLGYHAAKACDSSGQSGNTWGCSLQPQEVQCASGPCRLTDISAGMSHTCAIDVNQDAWCWGDNLFGQLGNGEFSGRAFGTPQGTPVPQKVLGNLKFLQIRAAFSSSCGLTTTHHVYCWGSNATSVIPDFALRFTNLPMQVDIPEPIAELDAAFSHACALAQSGNLFCWGSNLEGELVSNPYPNSATAAACSTCPAAPLLMQDRVPQLMGQRVSLQSTGAHGSCAHLSNGQTPCWGRQLPAFFPSSSLDRLSRGSRHYCAISRGDLFCAGVGALGDGFSEEKAPGTGPVNVVKPTNHFREVDTGDLATCAIGYNEILYCWGAATFGQVGTGDISVTLTKPTPVFFPMRIVVPPTYRRQP